VPNGHSAQSKGPVSGTKNREAARFRRRDNRLDRVQSTGSRSSRRCSLVVSILLRGVLVFPVIRRLGSMPLVVRRSLGPALVVPLVWRTSGRTSRPRSCYPGRGRWIARRETVLDCAILPPIVLVRGHHCVSSLIPPATGDVRASASTRQPLGRFPHHPLATPKPSSRAVPMGRPDPRSSTPGQRSDATRPASKGRR
jgi:hypothetical protein